MTRTPLKTLQEQETCKTCGKPHPSSLHGDIKKRDKNNDDSNVNPPIDPASPTVRCTKTCLMNNGYQYQISSMIVPVWVNHADTSQTPRLSHRKYWTIFKSTDPKRNYPCQPCMLRMSWCVARELRVFK